MAEQLTISTSQAQAQMDVLIKKLKDTGKEAGLSEREINDMAKALENAGSKGSQEMGNVNNQLKNTGNIANELGKRFLAAFAVERIIAFGQELVRIGVKYEALSTAIDFATGSQEQGAFAMEFISNLSNKLGLNLASAAEGFKQIAGAARGTALEGQATRDIFEGISLAASKMKLSADNTTGALLAISQMLSKGKVSAEELRGQLGERLPGAFGLFARSIGVSTQELDKMLEKGEVIATETLPKFAEQLKKEFGTGNTEAQGLGASIERLSNNWETFLFTIVSKDGGAIAKSINFIAEQVKNLNGLLAGEEDSVSANANKLFNELGNTSNIDELTSKINVLKQANSNLKDGFDTLNEDILTYQNALNESLFPSSKLENQIGALNEKLTATRIEYKANETAIKLLSDKITELNNKKVEQNKLSDEQIKKLQREREEAEKLLLSLRKRAEVELAGGGSSVGGLEVLEQQQQAELQKQIEQTKKAKKVAQLSELEINALKEQIAKEFDDKKFKSMEARLEEQKKLQVADILAMGLTQEQQNNTLLALENNYLQDKKNLYVQYGKDVSQILQNIQTNDMKFIQQSVDNFAKDKEAKLRAIEEEARRTRQTNLEVGTQAINNATNPIERENAQAANSLLNTQTEIDINKKKIQADIDYLEQKKALYLEYGLSIQDIEREISSQKDALQKQEIDNFKATEEEKTRIAQQQIEQRRALEQAAIDAGLQIFSAGVQIFKNIRQGDEQELAQEEERKIRQAGNNEAKKDAIRAEFEGKKKQRQRDAAVADKIAAGFEVVLNTASSIVKTGANLGYPLAIPFQVLAGAVGLAQLAVIASQPIPKFSTGVINFRGKRGDNNLALIADGESVITEKGTKKAPKTLEMINKGLLGDNEMKKLKSPEELGLLLGNGGGLDVNMLSEKLGDRFESSLKKLPQTKNFITDKGFFSIIKSGQNESLYINKLFGW